MIMTVCNIQFPGKSSSPNSGSTLGLSCLSCCGSFSSSGLAMASSLSMLSISRTGSETRRRIMRRKIPRADIIKVKCMLNKTKFMKSTVANKRQSLLYFAFLWLQTKWFLKLNFSFSFQFLRHKSQVQYLQVTRYTII